MVKIILGIEGMRCEMCEAHMDKAVNENFKVKRVASSHKKNTTVIVSKEDIAEDKLREVVEAEGFTLTSYKSEPYEKKGLFSFCKK
ncbi:MAG: cation transporter [Clostridia bacterium]|nr:cation transporter [Clostridia bacterium]